MQSKADEGSELPRWLATWYRSDPKHRHAASQWCNIENHGGAPTQTQLNLCVCVCVCVEGRESGAHALIVFILRVHARGGSNFII